MKQVILQQGGAALVDVPAPQVESGRLLVKVNHSCISVGTELSGVRAANRPLWKRAIDAPDDVRRVIARARDTGLAETRALVERKMKALNPIGYSASGIVIAVGEGIDGFQVGDRVACAGSASANHAEYISVPKNLAVPVPVPVSLDAASTVTLGAIALQGVRRAAPTLGETVLVSGLGILGQLTARLLQANGASVIGVDPRAERRAQAIAAGLSHALDPATEDVSALALRMTNGHGVDAAIITAAAPGDEILATAFQACRRKGRVVLVGDVGLSIDRQDIYAKELDFLVSTSYGPGRYDRRFEEEGLDYPLAYVRWTETRNMAAYLELLAEGKLQIDDLLKSVYPLESAPDAYTSLLSGGKNSPLAVLLKYGAAEGDDPARLKRTVERRAPVRKVAGRLGLGVIGAGEFATGTLLPILARHRDRFSLTGIASRQGVSATSVARQFDVPRAMTDASVLFDDPDTEAVLIGTRHHLHGTQVLQALTAGRHVFVEKPLCLTADELDRIEGFYSDRADDGGPVLMTGFNRRFAPPVALLSQRLAARKSPMMIALRVNAGYLPPDHWVHGPEGGGRNLGEACHFYDLFTALTASRVERVHALSLGHRDGAFRPDDNFTASIRFEDGSVAQLFYTALGDRRHSKERMEVFCDGVVHVLDDYTNLTSSDGQSVWQSRRPEKGHQEELLAFHAAIIEGGAWPIPLWQQVQATRIALSVQDAIVGG